MTTATRRLVAAVLTVPLGVAIALPAHAEPVPASDTSVIVDLLGGERTKLGIEGCVGGFNLLGPVSWVADGLMLDANLLLGLGNSRKFLNIGAWVADHVDWLLTSHTHFICEGNSIVPNPTPLPGPTPEPHPAPSSRE